MPCAVHSASCCAHVPMPFTPVMGWTRLEPPLPNEPPDWHTETIFTPLKPQQRVPILNPLGVSIWSAATHWTSLSVDFPRTVK